jgi:sulfite reductase (NADPH) flavoprotein alpha-component
MSANIVSAFPLGPLDPERSELLLRVVEGLEPATLQWLSGFAAGVAHERANRGAVAGPAPAPTSRQESAPRLTIVYGSQTGNGKRIAERLGRAAEAAGLAARVYSSASYPLKDLPKERLLVVVVSTQGDGDPPDDARGFMEFLASRRAPKLEQLSYSVLALGDSSYPKFCETGKQVDERLAALGAKRLLDRVDCDVDYDTLATPWLDRVVTTARENLGATAPVAATVTRLRAPSKEPQYSREQPFAAEVLANQRITARDATKDVRHVELALEGSGLTYAPGDALGVWHENPAPVVDEVLAALRLDGAQDIELDGQARSLRDWLTGHREITRLTRPFLVQQAERSKDETLAAVLQAGNEQALRGTLKDLQVVDVLQRHRGDWDAKSFVQALRPLAPRLYSIASSPDVVGEEVHVTVAVVEYDHAGQRRLGAASSYLAGLTGENARARVFIEHNERFRLPNDTSRDVIMIGPGTGVAPFRGFLQHREAQGAAGRNWLFFGARHFRSEFLYQVEWQEAVRKGVLTRLDAAFSRDRSTPRTYVQDRLRAAGRDVYDWLERGAYLYVCGDAEQMAPDVQAALVDVVAEHGGRSREDAESYVRALADERRYLRDVY